MTAQELQNYIGKLFFLEGPLWWINKKIPSTGIWDNKKERIFLLMGVDSVDDDYDASSVWGGSYGLRDMVNLRIFEDDRIFNVILNPKFLKTI